jgi:thiosulfate dehydrogenase [quinone] large subunit
MIALEDWRGHGIGTVRIVFGLVWAIDAQFKWRSDFVHGFVSYLTGALTNQPPLVQHWIGFWIDVAKVDPTIFAYVVALSETALAIALILGVLTDVACLGGVLLCLVIWSTAEGLGGPYVAGSTDIGTAIIYVFVFVLLFLTRAGLYYGIDRRLAGTLGSLSWLASGPADRLGTGTGAQLP